MQRDERRRAAGKRGRTAPFSMADPPGPFAPLSVWRQFLARLEEGLEAQPDDQGLQLSAKSAASGSRSRRTGEKE
jgi:hypothetical protein